jgi:protein-tyrosine-phosphatase
MSSRYSNTFSARHTLLPVIHVESLEQTLRNARIAFEAGCDGLFLINHGMSYRELLEIYRGTVQDFPNRWIGINCLDLPAEEVFRRIPSTVAGIWVDNALVDERTADLAEAEQVRQAQLRSGWRGIYFGGVAFKYQRPVQDLARAARLAADYMDVVTTSGSGTGLAAPIEKIRAMKRALGDHPLAIASGITPANVHDYLDVADCFLVATGISRSFTEFDPARVRALVAAVRSWASLPAGQRLNQVCFVCEWNEGRSPHLELSTRLRLRRSGSRVQVTSAGLSQGGRINALRRKFLAQIGVPAEQIANHRSTLFGPQHADADLILVAELPMKRRILRTYPELDGRVMTVKGFALGFWPDDEPLLEAKAHIEDAGGHSDPEKLALYAELEKLAEQITSRLIAIEQSSFLR